MTDNDKPQDLPATTTPAELGDADLEQAAGGVTTHDISFTKPVDKSSPTLHL